MLSGPGMTLKTVIADAGAPRSLAARARRRRLLCMAKRFPDLGSMRVLDLGGSLGFWKLAPVRPREIVLLNLTADQLGGDGLTPPGIRHVIGDACALPAEIRDASFDLVFSNSVIEHVGGHARRRQFADQVRSVATHYWIQTPYRYFPVEPHWLFPGQQFLPPSAKAWVSQRWKAGHIRSADGACAVEDVLSVELLGVTEMRHYFPEAQIIRERFGGLVKSLVAVR